MKTPHLLLALVLTGTLSNGCKKSAQAPSQTAQPTPSKTEPLTSGPSALPADNQYTTGAVEAVVMDVQTKLALAQLAPSAQVPPEVKKAQENSVFNQRMVVSEERGKMIFSTADLFIPKGTELRYNPEHNKYALSDPGKKLYWAMTGAEIGNLLEGGPAMERTNYSIAISDTKQEETIAGVTAVRTNAAIGFDWSIRSKSGDKSGKVKISLAIWHSADAKLKPKWGKMMVDFLTVPFQDQNGQKVVDVLKQKIRFPVKWLMEVVNLGQTKEQGELPPRLETIAQRLEVTPIPKIELSSPPVGYSPASGPYEFGEGGQTVSEELLSKIPAHKGAPPKNVEPPKGK